MSTPACFACLHSCRAYLIYLLFLYFSFLYLPLYLFFILPILIYYFRRLFCSPRPVLWFFLISPCVSCVSQLLDCGFYLQSILVLRFSLLRAKFLKLLSLYSSFVFMKFSLLLFTCISLLLSRIPSRLLRGFSLWCGFYY